MHLAKVWRRGSPEEIVETYLVDMLRVMLDLSHPRELEFSTWRREYVQKWTFREELNHDDPYFDEKTAERASPDYVKYMSAYRAYERLLFLKADNFTVHSNYFVGSKFKIVDGKFVDKTPVDGDSRNENP